MPEQNNNTPEEIEAMIAQLSIVRAPATLEARLFTATAAPARRDARWIPLLWTLLAAASLLAVLLLKNQDKPAQPRQPRPGPERMATPAVAAGLTWSDAADGVTWALEAPAELPLDRAPWLKLYIKNVSGQDRYIPKNISDRYSDRSAFEVTATGPGVESNAPQTAGGGNPPLAFHEENYARLSDGEAMMVLFVPEYFETTAAEKQPSMPVAATWEEPQYYGCRMTGDYTYTVTYTADDEHASVFPADRRPFLWNRGFTATCAFRATPIPGVEFGVADQGLAAALYFAKRESSRPAYFPGYLVVRNTGAQPVPFRVDTAMGTELFAGEELFTVNSKSAGVTAPLDGRRYSPRVFDIPIGADYRISLSIRADYDQGIGSAAALLSEGVNRVAFQLDMSKTPGIAGKPYWTGRVTTPQVELTLTRLQRYTVYFKENGAVSVGEEFLRRHGLQGSPMTWQDACNGVRFDMDPLTAPAGLLETLREDPLVNTIENR